MCFLAFKIHGCNGVDLLDSTFLLIFKRMQYFPIEGMMGGAPLTTTCMIILQGPKSGNFSECKIKRFIQKFHT